MGSWGCSFVHCLIPPRHSAALSCQDGEPGLCPKLPSGNQRLCPGVRETPKSSPAAPGESVPSIWSGSSCSAEHVLRCALPKLLDGEIRAKAKSSFSTGEPSTNTIKGLEGRGPGACRDFPTHLSGRGSFPEVRKCKRDAAKRPRVHSPAGLP